MSSVNDVLNRVASFSINKVAIFSLAVTVAYYVFLFDNGATLETEIQGLETTLTTEQNTKKETEKILQKEEQMRADVALLAKLYEEVKSQIPLEFETSELRAIVKQIADQTGIRILRQKDTQSVDQYQGVAESQLIESIYVDYVFQGNYQQIIKFAQLLSQTQKIIRLTDLKINKMEVGTGPGPIRSLNFEAKVVGYKQSLYSKNEKKVGAANNSGAKP